MSLKIKQILQQLVDSTKSDSIIWKMRDSCFNSNSNHHYHTISSDGLTSFEIQISLNEQLNNIRYHNCLWIKNENLIDGRKQVPSCDLTKELEYLIFNKYIKSNVQVIIEDGVFDSILESIETKESSRDSKISKILGSEVSENTKSLIKKLFS